MISKSTGLAVQPGVSSRGKNRAPQAAPQVAEFDFSPGHPVLNAGPLAFNPIAHVYPLVTRLPPADGRRQRRTNSLHAGHPR